MKLGFVLGAVGLIDVSTRAVCGEYGFLPGVQRLHVVVCSVLNQCCKYAWITRAR